MNPETRYDYSVVVPVYNSRETLLELCARIETTLSSKSFELILVDDKSADNSWEIIQRLKMDFPVTKLHHSANLGQALACKTGIKHSNGRLIITIDDDLQYAPEQIADLIKARSESGAELVYGIPKKYQQPAWRKLGSYLAGSIGKKGSSFRLFTSEIGQQVVRQTQPHILLDLELQQYAQSIYRVPVAHQKRKYGNSNYSLLNLAKISFYSFLFHLGFKGGSHGT